MEIKFAWKEGGRKRIREESEQEREEPRAK